MSTWLFGLVISRCIISVGMCSGISSVNFAQSSFYISDYAEYERTGKKKEKYPAETKAMFTRDRNCSDPVAVPFRSALWISVHTGSDQFRASLGVCSHEDPDPFRSRIFPAF